MLFLGKKFAGATFGKAENFNDFLLKYCNKELIEYTTPNDCDIRGDLFKDHTRLEKITIGDGCKSIDSGAFMYCSSLKHVYIPNSILNISSDAFSGCSEIHFIVDKSQYEINGFPWGATNCTVEYLRIDENIPTISSDYIYYNDYNTMESSSQQRNGWHGFVFRPDLIPCTNPEMIDYLYGGRQIGGLEVMKNPFARLDYIQFSPVYVEIYDLYSNTLLATSLNQETILPGTSFEEFVQFVFDKPITLQPDGYYKVHFKMVGYEHSSPQSNQVSPATYYIEPYDMAVGCFWQNTHDMGQNRDMVVFKLNFI